MRRFVSLAVLLFFTVPFGASLAGCGSKTITQYCSGSDSGPVVGQVKSIVLSPNFSTYGESLDYGEIGTGLSATAVDCKGSPVSVRSYTYATSDMNFADINPMNGSVCGGTWNRNTGGGIGDYTICTAPVNPPDNTVARITATAEGGVSNGFQVYVHPKATAVVIGPPTPQNRCFVLSDAITALSISRTTSTTGIVTFQGANTFVAGEQVTISGLSSDAAKAVGLNGMTLVVATVTANQFTAIFNYPGTNGDVALTNDMGTATFTPTDISTNCCPQSTTAPVTADPYLGGACLSQGISRQITARVYKSGTTNPADNITCAVGHVQYAAQNASVLTLDENGVATAAQPGSTIVTASVSTSGSGGAAGYFATCPPASIDLQVAGNGGGDSAIVNVNNTQPLTAVVTDTNGVQLNGISLQFLSTSPSTIAAGTGGVVPLFPGAATVTAICQPPSCNSAPFSQVGLYGNGKPLTSNGVRITAPGNNATVLYIGSTASQYLLPVDFSTGQQGSLVKLPYTPNSMVITQNGSNIYLGSTTALMVVSAANNQLSATYQAVPGTVLSVSPDGSTIVVTDPDRKTVSLVSSAGVAAATTGGVGVSAQWAPDSQTVYIVAENKQLLVHSAFTGWNVITTEHQYNDVAVMVPSVGAFFATDTNVTEGRTYCSTSTITAPGNPAVETNVFYPVASDTTVQTDRLAATNDENHILGATKTPAPTLNDITIQQPLSDEALSCPTATSAISFGTSNASHPLTGVTASAITGVVPSSDSTVAFVTYTGTSGLLPVYLPQSGGLSLLSLSGGTTTAPVAGVFSTDNKTFYVGTSGDNQIHLININGTTATDSSAINPKLPDINGNPIAVPNLLVQRPKKATS